MILRHALKLGLWSLVLMAALDSAGIARAQAPGPITKEEFSKAQLQPQAIPGPGVDAGQVRSQLMEIFQQYPPSVREVLQLDPLLMSNANYLTLYPRLAAFLSEHPEVAHNYVFFIGLPDEYNRNSRVAESFGRSMERIVTPMMVAGVVISMIGILA